MARAKQAEQDAITAQKNGEAEAAKAKWEQAFGTKKPKADPDNPDLPQQPRGPGGPDPNRPSAPDSCA